MTEIAATVRTATREDAAAISLVRVRTWQAAYRGLIADAVLDGLDARAEGVRRAQRWDLYTADPRSRQLVAEVQGRIVGWAAVGPSRDAARAQDGELMAIYVLPAFWSTGVGHRLMVAAEEALREGGFAGAHLWVLDGNERAADFYERHGWREDGGEKVDTHFVTDALHERRRVRDLREPASREA